MEPSVDDHLGRGLGIVVVTEHHHGAADADLAGIDLEFGIRHGQAGGVILEIVDAVEGDDGRRLRQTVSLDDGEAELPQPPGDVGRDRGAAADEQSQPAAETLVQGLEHLSPDVLVEQSFGQGGQPLADSELGHALFGDPFHDLAVDGVPQERHAQQDGRMDLLQVFRDALEVFGESHGHAVGDRSQEAAGALVGVVEGQDAQENIRMADRNDAEDRTQVRDDVVLAEHHPFRRARRARGEQDAAGQFRLDDGEGVVGGVFIEQLAPLAQDVRELEDHGVFGPVVHVDDVAEAGQGVGHLQHHVHVLLGADEDFRLGCV